MTVFSGGMLSPIYRPAEHTSLIVLCKKWLCDYGSRPRVLYQSQKLLTVATIPVRGYASRRRVRGRLVASQIAEIKASRKPYVETRKYLKTSPLPAVNPIFGTYSPMVKKIMRTLGSEDPRALSDEEDQEGRISESEPAYGLSSAEVQYVVAGAQTASIVRASPAIYGSSATQLVGAKTEQKRTEALNRILTLRHANAAQEKSRLIQQAIAEVGFHSLDTGSAESQAAIMTVHIIAIAEHLRYNRHDVAAKGRLTMKVQQRNSILKYLRKHSMPRYNIILQKLGLSNESVMSEFRLYPRLLE